MDALTTDVKKVIKMVDVSSIIFKQELYAREEPDPALIQEYKDNIDEILKSGNKVEVSADLILIDGFHRWKAAEAAGKTEIECIVHETTDSDYIELESYAANTRHGKRNTKAENYRNIRRLYSKGHSLDVIQDRLGFSKAIVYDATSGDRKEEKKEREKLIIRHYLRAWNSQQRVADIINEWAGDREHLKISRHSITNLIANFSARGKISNELFIYNIWSKADGNETDHFGSFPEKYMENLLYYHTDPMDVVFDPFCGNGTTIDVCRRMMRRYYTSDIEIKPGREDDTKEHDITTGLPDDLPQVINLAFLDPPYWAQAEGKYLQHENQLGDMDLKKFNESMFQLLSVLAGKKTRRIAIVIQPTQYKNQFDWIDHIFDFHKMIGDAYKIEARYILPYSTQQYNAQMVDKAKEQKKCLGLNRDLVVWKLK